MGDGDGISRGAGVCDYCAVCRRASLDRRLVATGAYRERSRGGCAHLYCRADALPARDLWICTAYRLRLRIRSWGFPVYQPGLSWDQATATLCRIQTSLWTR